MNLGVFGPKQDATVMYRGLGVLHDLKSKGVNVIKCESSDYISLKQFDVVFVQRPHSEAHLHLCKEVVNMGIPLWLDYDDFLFDVPISNGAYKLYMNTACHSRMAEMIELASVVTVSTMALKALLEISDTPVVCVPNLYDPVYHGKVSTAQRSEWITWRGSNTHQEDLMSVYEPICDFLASNSSARIEFIGHVFWQLLEKFPKQVRCVGPMPWFEYISYLKNRAPKIHIVPLKDNIFNKCKSNVSMIEGRVAGAAVIAPDWYEWQTADAKYKTKDDFYNLLSTACKKQDSLPSVADRYKIVTALASGDEISANRIKEDERKLYI